jgi:hypothetical protein
LPICQKNQRFASHSELETGFAFDGPLNAAFYAWLSTLNAAKPLDARLRNRPLDVYKFLLRVYLGSYLAGEPYPGSRMQVAYAFLDPKTATTRTPNGWMERLQNLRLIEPWWKWEFVGGEACLSVDLSRHPPFFNAPAFARILNAVSRSYAT